jgi:transcriptional regulator with XRE-family HTH domain
MSNDIGQAGPSATGRAARRVGMQVDGSLDDHRYAVTVGARLRAIRGQQRLSLQDVEARSREEFKASVLGAYERGERAISVARLQRLAHFYGVPVDQLLPGDTGPQFGPRPGDGAPGADAVAVDDAFGKPIRIDITALTSSDQPRAELLTRFVRLIQVQRGDFNGQVLTIRGADHGAVACILDVAPDAVAEELGALGFLFDPSRP